MPYWRALSSVGSTASNENRSPSYAQLYLYDPAEARQFQLTRNNHLDANTMSDLQDMMLEHNPFVNIFRQAQEILQEQSEDSHLHVHLTYKAHTDPLTSIESSISGMMHFAIANLPSEMAQYSWGNLIMYIVNNMVMETLTVLSPSPIHLNRVQFTVELR